MTEGRSLVLSAEDRVRVEEVDVLARRAAPEDLAALVALLVEPSWAVRRAVVGALASIGAPAVPSLVEVLTSQRDREARIAAAVDALAASSAPVEAEMVRLAEHADSAIVCDALQVLGRRRARDTVPLLATLARHEDDNVGVAAIEALGRIGGPETVDALVAAVEARNFFRTHPAIDALGRTGDVRAVAPLTGLLGDKLYAPEAARGLGHTGDEGAVVPLAQLLERGTDPLVRTAAIALAELRERHQARFGDTPTLARALPDAVSGSDASARLVGVMPGVAPSELVAFARVFGWLGDPVAIEQLVALALEAAPVGTAAAEALRRTGGRATPILLARIGAGSSAERLRLLPLVGYAFERIGDLVACLDDADPDVRVRACEALARAGDPSAVGALFKLIGDRDARVSQSAAAAIQSLGSLETKRLALEQARSGDLRVRRAAMRILSYFGYAESLDVLVAALEDEDEKMREAAINGLPLVEDPRAVTALLEASKHPVAKTRSVVMRALGQTENAPAIVEALHRGLADDDAWVRYYACQSLGRLRITDAVDAVVERIQDPSGQVRIAAVEALARLGGGRAVDALEAAARASDADLQRAALVGLGIAKRVEALPTLRAAAVAEEAATRLVAIGALAEFDSADVVPTLAHAATDPDEGVRSAAIGYLSTRPGADTTAALVARVVDPVTRHRALEALAVAADDRVDGVLAALESADADTAPLFVAALTRMRRPSSQAAIAAALGFDNVNARRAAAAALAATGTPEAHDALRRAASDPDPVVRRLCATLHRR